MKKVNLSLIGCVLCILIFSGCSNTSPQKTTYNKNIHSGEDIVVDKNIPEWAKFPELGMKEKGIKKGIAEVGISPYNKYSYKRMMSKAKANARANLVLLINQRISYLYEEAVKEAKIDFNSSDSFVVNEVTKIWIKDSKLSGAKPLDLYHSETTGDMYVLMALPLNEVLNELENTKLTLVNELERNGLITEKAEEAVKNIFEKFEKEFSN